MSDRIGVMSTFVIGFIVFGCVLGGALVGMVLRSLLPKEHLSDQSKEVIKLGMGVVGTMSALVIGLMVGAAKGTFDAQRNGMTQLAGNALFLDHVLNRYGPEAKDA